MKTLNLESLYSELQKQAPEIFPELRFRKRDNGWEATTGEIRGEKAKGHLYWYDDNPHCLKNQKTEDAIWIADAHMEFHGLGSQREALVDLARRVNFPLDDLAPEEIAKIEQAASDQALMEDFYQFTRQQLEEEAGASTLAYLQTERGYSLEEIRAMGLGHNPGWEASMTYLQGKGYELAPEEGPLKWLIWRDAYKLVLPWKAVSGRIKGLISRRLGFVPKGEDKYKPITDTRGLQAEVFGLGNVKGSDHAIGVEGLFDCLFAGIKGIGKVVAWEGLIPSKAQLKTLKTDGIKYITFVPDNNERGMEGAEKGLRLAAEMGFKCFVVRLPEGVKDLDELIRRDGVEVAKEVLHSAVSSARWMTERLIKGIDPTTPLEVARAVDQVMSFGATLDPLGRNEVGGVIREALDIDDATLVELLEEGRQDREKTEFLHSVGRESAQLNAAVGKGDIDGIRQILNEIPDRLPLIIKEEPSAFDPDAVAEKIRQSPPRRLTGYKILDDTCQVHAPSVNVIAGRSGHCKTTSGCNLTVNMAAQSEMPIIYISLEVPEEQMLAKLLGAMTGRSSQNILRQFRQGPSEEGGLLSGNVLSAYEQLVRYHDDQRLFVNDSRKQTADSIAKYCSRVKREYGDIGAIFVDYLGLIVPSGDSNTEQRYAQTMVKLGDLAREVEAPIFILAQMNREASKPNSNKEGVSRYYPGPEDLRYSDQILHDADQVWGLFNHSWLPDKESDKERNNELKKPGDDVEVQVDLISLKSRYGKIFDPIKMKLINGTRLEELPDQLKTPGQLPYRQPIQDKIQDLCPDPIPMMGS